jgi:hypothetical protein
VWQCEDARRVVNFFLTRSLKRWHDAHPSRFALNNFLEPEMKQTRHFDRLNPSHCLRAGGFAPAAFAMLEERLVSGETTMA